MQPRIKRLRHLGSYSVALLVSTAATIGCARESPGPASPSREPSSVAASCSNPALLRRTLEGLAPTAVVRVQPRLFWNTCAGTAAVAGTELHLRAADLSAETLAQLGDCHYARIHVGGEDEKGGGPGASWLSHGWLDVDADVAGSEVTVLLSAATVPENIRMFHEATTFARRSGNAAEMAPADSGRTLRSRP